MTQEDYKHPITPPPELVRKWATWRNAVDEESFWRRIATEAAQWGADQELEACCEWVKSKHWIEPEFAGELRAARRPKPPSLKEQAMQALCRFMASEGHEDCTEEEVEGDFNTIRQALEQLPDAQ